MVAIATNYPVLPSAPIPPPSSTGFSFSPGGLLFAYHLGVITSLQHHGRVSDPVHLAGASAGAIAVASHAAGTPPARALEAAFRVCEECESQFNGRAVGNLLPLLKVEMDRTLGPDAHTIINEREGVVALAHRELFPVNRPVLTTSFQTRDELIEAVCDSSMFPFFSTPFPARLRYKVGERIPRVIVDGFFSVPRERYGCPDFAQLNVRSKVENRFLNMGGVLVDENQNTNEKNDSSECNEMPIIERTITVACFPHEVVGLTASLKHDQISPEPDYDDPVGQMSEFFRLATQPSSRKEQEALFEKGCADAERWCYEEDLRERELTVAWLKEKRLENEINEAIRSGDLF